MNLLEKLNNINKPNIKPLPKGEVFSVEQIWDELIKGYLPKKEIVLAWHEILFEYIHTGFPTFAIRGYNTFPKEKNLTIFIFPSKTANHRIFPKNKEKQEKEKMF